MSRSTVTQQQRTQKNPLMLGSFSSTAIKYLRGSLGPKNQLVGSADTWDQSRGGFGGGTYNHWFKVEITSPAWIILVDDSPRPQYIHLSAYDLNVNPIQGRSIFDQDSVAVPTTSGTYYPYFGDVMAAQSDLYNTFSSVRLDRGDDRYYTLNAGNYLICVSTTRNEPQDYAFALVVEFPTTEGYFQLEDFEGGLFLTEDSFNIILDPGDDSFYESIHDHSLSEWKEIWSASHQDTDKFPSVLVPLANRA